MLLAEIYRELGHAFAFSDEDLRYLRDAEVKLECRMLRPVPAGRALIERERAAGKQIIFVSDMYLPDSLVMDLLDEYGLWTARDRLYVSGEQGHTKASSGLFKSVLSQEGVASSDVTHIGNDMRGDVRVPQRLALDTSPLLDANLNRYEEVLDSYAAATDGLTAVLGGAARLARLEVPASDEEAVLRDVAASVGGPLLVAYVLWVLNTAQRRGIEHLYFLSRDGQVLLEIARRLAPKINYTGRLAYLFCSRMAVNFAAFGGDLAGQSPWLWTHESGTTCRSVLAQIGVEPEEIRAQLIDLGLPPDAWAQPLHKDGRQRLLAFLQGPFRGRLEQIHLQRRSLVLDYLKAERFLKEAEIGIVDLGGAGSQYRALRILREHVGRSAPTGFVMHLDPPLTTGADETGVLEDEDIHAWLNDMRRHLGFPRLGGLAALLLMFCQATHGTVTGYQRRSEHIEPVLRQIRGTDPSGAQFRLVRQTVLRVAEEVVLDDDLVDRHADVRRPISDILALFWEQPSRAEAAAWAWVGLEESSDPSEGGDPLASPYGLAELARMVRYRAWPGPWHRWRKASVEVTPLVIRGPLKAALWARRRRRRGV